MDNYPWTIPSNRAIAINPELDYALVQLGDERVLLAVDLVEDVAKAAGVESAEILATTKGENLELLRFNHPFYDYSVPFILATTLPQTVVQG